MPLSAIVPLDLALLHCSEQGIMLASWHQKVKRLHKCTKSVSQCNAAPCRLFQPAGRFPEAIAAACKQADKGQPFAKALMMNAVDAVLRTSGSVCNAKLSYVVVSYNSGR